MCQNTKEIKGKDNGHRELSNSRCNKCFQDMIKEYICVDCLLNGIKEHYDKENESK